MPTDDRNRLRDALGDAASEPGPQPDPLLEEGPANPVRSWAVTGAIAAVLLAVMYGVTAHRAEVKDEQRQIEMQKDATPAPTVSPSVTKPGQ